VVEVVILTKVVVHALIEVRVCLAAWEIWRGKSVVRGQRHRVVTTCMALHHKGLNAAVQRYGVPPAVVEDILQEVWVRLWRHGHAVKAPALLSWLHRTAYRLSIDYHRRSVVSVPLDPDAWQHDVHHDEYLDGRRAMSWLASLDHHYQQVVWYVDIDERTFVEAADLCHVSESTARRWYRQAHAILRAKMNP